MNKVMLVGNIASELVVRKTPNDVSVLNFTLCVSRPYKSQGVRKYEKTYLEMEAWDSGAETIAKFFKKGDVIHIESEVKSKKFVKNEETVYKTVFRVKEFEFPPKAWDVQNNNKSDKSDESNEDE